MGIGIFILELVTPLMESMAPRMPGETFPKFFTLRCSNVRYLRPVMVAIVGGFLGSFLLIRNLSLIGDGLAHVSFGGVAVGIVIGFCFSIMVCLGIQHNCIHNNIRTPIERNINRRRLDCHISHWDARIWSGITEIFWSWNYSTSRELSMG